MNVLIYNNTFDKTTVLFTNCWGVFTHIFDSPMNPGLDSLSQYFRYRAKSIQFFTLPLVPNMMQKNQKKYEPIPITLWPTNDSTPDRQAHNQGRLLQTLFG